MFNDPFLQLPAGFYVVGVPHGTEPVTREITTCLPTRARVVHLLNAYIKEYYLV